MIYVDLFLTFILEVSFWKFSETGKVGQIPVIIFFFKSNFRSLREMFKSDVSQSEGVTADAHPIRRRHSWCYPDLKEPQLMLISYVLYLWALFENPLHRCTRPLSLFLICERFPKIRLDLCALQMELPQFACAAHGTGSICERCTWKWLNLWALHIEQAQFVIYHPSFPSCAAYIDIFLHYGDLGDFLYFYK
jgi:hypothetical protein